MDLFADYMDYIKSLSADEQEDLWFEVSFSLRYITLFICILSR